MKNKIIVCQGLPSSGKSRWAKEFVKNNKGYLRISNDDFRLMFFNRQFDKDDTTFIDDAREVLIEHFMKQNRISLVIDNTNLSPNRINRFEQLSKSYNYQLEIKSFCDIPLKLCIERDKYREFSVGEKVIRQMYNQFLKKEIEVPKIEYDPNKFDCVILDLDNSIAKMCDRSPYDEAKSDGDYLNEHVYHLVTCLLNPPPNKKKPSLIIVSGRDEGRGREATERWLEKYNIPYDYLHMRKSGDSRKDDLIKSEIYNEHIKDKFNVVAVLDDRLSVCKYWHSIGLPLFRIGDPEADF